MKTKINTATALSFIDNLMGRVEKVAEESPANVKDVGGEPAGTVKATVANKGDQEEKSETAPKEGSFGKEKASDTTDSVPGTSVQSSAAANTANPNKGVAAVGDFNAEFINRTTPS